MTIGVLALQGDFDAYRRRLQELGAEVVLVKKPEQLDQIDGLVIPGIRKDCWRKIAITLKTTQSRRSHWRRPSRATHQQSFETCFSILPNLVKPLF